MKIKRIKKLRINSYEFTIKWDSSTKNCGLSYVDMVISIGTESAGALEIFGNVCHELWEVVAIENHVRMQRPDCNGGDWIFVYDHRQHDVMANMFAGLLAQFLT